MNAAEVQAAADELVALLKKYFGDGLDIEVGTVTREHPVLISSSEQKETPAGVSFFVSRGGARTVRCGTSRRRPLHAVQHTVP